MPRQGKRYICIDWNFFDDAFEDGLTERAMVLFQRMLIHCARTGSDGLASRSALRRLGLANYQASLEVLVRAGWVEKKDDDTFVIPSWHKWNEPMDRVSARRRADRQRKRTKNSIPREAFRLPD